MNILRKVVCLSLFLSLGFCGRTRRQVDPPPDPNFTPNLIRSYGYPVEIHYMTTDDNYILTMHRIPGGRFQDVESKGKSIREKFNENLLLMEMNDDLNRIKRTRNSRRRQYYNNRGRRRRVRRSSVNSVEDVSKFANTFDDTFEVSSSENTIINEIIDNSPEDIFENSNSIENILTVKDISPEEIFKNSNSIEDKSTVKAIVKSSPRPVVFMMHCFLCSSWSWVVLGPGKALALLLADNGFDVWMLNSRGSVPSTNHTKYSRLDPEYWKFSWHEQAVYDVPCAIDYILKKTGQSQLEYVGFSMGTSLYFVLMSERPEYHKKINRMIALAPSAFNELSDGYTSRMSHFEPILQKFDKFTTILEFPPLYFHFQDYFSSSCTPGTFLYKISCPHMLNIVGGSYTTNADKDKLPFYMEHALDTTSHQAFLHYCQIRNKANFCAFDYGTELNLYHYGKPKAPEYNLTRSVNSVYLFWAEKDLLTHKDDVKRLSQLLPNIALNYRVPDLSFTHRDFVWARNVHKLVYRKVLEILLS